MKSLKKQTIGICCVAMLFLFITACQKDLINDLSPRYSLYKELSLINDEHNKTKSLVDREGFLFTSEVKLVKEDNSFVLFVNDEVRGVKRKFKVSFLPNVDMSLPASHIDKAEILSIRHFLVVNSLDKPNVYVFTLIKQDLSPIVDKIKGAVTKDMTVYNGYGITMHSSKLEDVTGK